MTKNQEAERLVWLHSTLETLLIDDSTGLMFRPQKLQRRFDEFKIDFMDLLYALENRNESVMRDGHGERFEVTGTSIDGDSLKLILTAKGESNLKIVDFWIDD